MAIAVAGLTTASLGLVISGISNRKASICQAVETSSWSRVRRDGTIDTSSRSYPRRAKRFSPISTLSRTGIGSPTSVVGGFGGHLDVVRVTLGEPGGGDPGELPALLQLGDGGRAGVAHAGPQAAGELVGGAGQRAAVGHLALDPLGDELVVGEDVVGEVPVPAEGLVAPALLHGAQRAHAAVGLVLLAVGEHQLAGGLLDAGE